MYIAQNKPGTKSRVDLKTQKPCPESGQPFTFRKVQKQRNNRLYILVSSQKAGS